MSFTKAVQVLNEIAAKELGETKRSYKRQYIAKRRIAGVGVTYDFTCADCDRVFGTNFARFPKGVKPLCVGCLKKNNPQKVGE